LPGSGGEPIPGGSVEPDRPVDPGAPSAPGRLQGLGRPHTLGRPRVHLRQTGSTNDRARDLAAAGAPHGTLVTASSQSAGRGRQGRGWSAPANSSLLMSLLLRSPPPLLPLIAAVAVCDVAGDQALIKWPNDIVIVREPHGTCARDGHQRTSLEQIDSERAWGPADEVPGTPTLVKLAGILTEGRPQAGWAVLGIGLNVAVRLEELPIELRHAAATLGYAPDAVEPTLELLLAALARRLEEPTARALDEWRARDALYGREVAWSTGRGRAQGIDAAGRLVVALDGGEQIALDAGEVHLEAG
jgi:BirA family transcriptional regulator, biotin operon repressor / biotin---[acetyl-CoA-carboxylase] ligase